MKIQGIIAEYNPFHNGHKFHIEAGKEKSSSTHTIVVMSGNFVQRGEPAIFDKFKRTKMAISAGADIVIELPTVFSLGSAEFFGYGAVSLLDSLSIVDVLSFGCEDDNMEPFETISEVLCNEPTEYKKILKNHLDTGVSFPKAREKALSQYAFSGNDVEELFKPNNILGIEYLKSLRKLRSNIKPNPIKRTGVSYYSSDIINGIASATKIRQLITTGNISMIEKAVPKNIFSEISQLVSSNEHCTMKNFENIIYSNFIFSSPSYLNNISDISEGIENRIINNINPAESIDHFLDTISTKRYTRTRLQRILMKTMLGITNDYYKDASGTYTKPLYGRILGFNSKGREILGKLKKASQIPLITNMNKFDKSILPDKGRMLEMDILASNAYSLATKKSLYRDLTEGVYIHK